MVKRVLIIGGRGRVGSGVAADLVSYTDADITITGRTENSNGDPSHPRMHYLALDLNDGPQLQQAIAPHDLVVHCAGPFRQRSAMVLKACIDAGINYLDVSDDRHFTHNALSLSPIAEAAGITAVINTGVFPGISNSMARLGVEQLDSTEEIHLNYAVAGSGGAGLTVMRTTFLNLLEPFDVHLKGQWQQVQPYSSREAIEFPNPFGRSGVYWFELPESVTLAKNFSINTVTTKFGAFPDFYNHLTWMVAHWLPKPMVRHPLFVEALARISYGMTAVTDRFSGTGVAVRVDVVGCKNNWPARYTSTLVHPNAAIATGLGTGIVAGYVLSDQIQHRGVYTVEQVLPTDLFLQAVTRRNLSLQHYCSPENGKPN